MKRLSSHNHLNQLFRSLRSLLEDAYMPDITLVAEGKAICAHKVILAACSPYLKNDIIMDDVGQIQNVLFDGIKFDNLKCIIDFMYSGQLELSQDNVQDLYAAFKWLKLENGSTLCELFMGSPNADINCDQVKPVMCETASQTDDSGVYIVTGKKRGRKRKSEVEEIQKKQEQEGNIVTETPILGRGRRSSSRRAIKTPQRFNDSVLTLYSSDKSDNPRVKAGVTVTEEEQEAASDSDYLANEDEECCSSDTKRSTLSKRESVSANTSKSHARKKVYKCEHDTNCNYKTRYRMRYVTHSNLHHSVPYPQDVTQLNCEVCPYKTVMGPAELEKHKAANHISGVKKFSCPFCDRKFRTNGTLTTHKRIHTGDKPFSCNDCSSHFRQSGSLKIHRARRHGDTSRITTHMCNKCDYSTVSRRSLVIHTFHKHQEPLPSHFPRYNCENCDAKFYSKIKFNIHQKRHKGERLFSCSVCEKKFVNKDEVNAHMKWHLERKVKCTYEGCDHATVDSSHLKSHVRLMHTHKGQKPFHCPLCHYKCAVKGNLVKHIRLVHHMDVLTNQKVITPTPIKTRSVERSDIGEANLTVKVTDKETLSQDTLLMIQAALSESSVNNPDINKITFLTKDQQPMLELNSEQIEYVVVDEGLHQLSNTVQGDSVTEELSQCMNNEETKEIGQLEN